MASGSYWISAILTVFVVTYPALADDSLTYPETHRIDHVDNYHGTEVADPYRWLEDDVRESDDVQDWVNRQNEVTFAFLEKLPEREALRERLTELWDYEKRGLPTKRGKRYFFSRNDGLQNQSVLYMQEGFPGEAKVLLDPNTWSGDGTVALSGTAYSPDGRYLAYSISEAGSDWKSIRLLDIDSGEVLPDTIDWVKYSGATWSKDSKGFYYGRFDEPKEGDEFQSLTFGMKLYYHRLSTPQEEDILVYERPDHPDWGFGIDATDDGNYVVLTAWIGTDDRYRVFVRNLNDEDASARHLLGDFDADYTYIGNRGKQFYFYTNLSAPNGKLVAFDLDDAENWSTIIPEQSEVLRFVQHTGNHFIASYLQDAKSLIQVYDELGKHIRDVDLPGIGSASGFGGRPNDPETFYSFSSFATPSSLYRYDVATGESNLFWRANVDFDADRYEVKQVFYRSKDGTRVPMFITHKKGLKIDGNNRALLYGYGGFNIPMTPGFSVSRALWLEHGGVYAVANLRGGGEYGKAWHKAGTKLQKQNVFDDFIAAAEYLHDHDYTRPDLLTIQGGSNGGLLVGAAMTQRPELFGVALPAVGVMDMLRFHKFTAGRFWTDDYGSSDNPEEFKAIYAYSPYHNLRPGTVYPPTLVTTADTDDRVVPGHSFKFAAGLQAAHAGEAPVLIRIETRAGHGAGKPTSKRIEEITDQYAFALHHTRPE